VRQDL